MEISVFFSNPILLVSYIIALAFLIVSLWKSKLLVLPGIALLAFAGVLLYAFFVAAELSHILIALFIGLIPCAILLYWRGKKE